MKFEIRNRWTGDVQFTAEIECAADAPLSIKVGLAVKWGYLRGVDLRGADLRGADLRGADLRGAVLRGAVLRGAVLSAADLRGVDLRGADLRGAVLRGVVLSAADLRGVDLREGLKGVPVVPNIDAAILAQIEGDGATGALYMGQWHSCATTHCRAGWAITLAGAGGAALEWALGSAAAGALIYAASRPGKPIPDFYASNEAALADMRAAAAEDAAPVVRAGDGDAA